VDGYCKRLQRDMLSWLSNIRKNGGKRSKKENSKVRKLKRKLLRLLKVKIIMKV
jgi:hypothetical protein